MELKTAFLYIHTIRKKSENAFEGKGFDFEPPYLPSLGTPVLLRTSEHGDRRSAVRTVVHRLLSVSSHHCLSLSSASSPASAASLSSATPTITWPGQAAIAVPACRAIVSRDIMSTSFRSVGRVLNRHVCHAHHSTASRAEGAIWNSAIRFPSGILSAATVYGIFSTVRLYICVFGNNSLVWKRLYQGKSFENVTFGSIIIW